jgi:hypothetical protein
LAASLTSEQAQLQAIQQWAPTWTAGKKAHAQWEQQVARRKTRIAQIALRLDRVGEIEEAAGVYAETKIEELAEHKLRFEKPELTLEWDKIQRRERQALIPNIESTQSRGQDLGRSLTLSMVEEQWAIPGSTVDRLGAVPNTAHPLLGSARPAFSCHQTYLLRSSVGPVAGHTFSAIVCWPN